MSGERRESGAPRPPGGSPMAAFGRGPMPGMGGPVQKAKDFKGTLKRLFGFLRPFRGQLLVVLIAAVLSTVFYIVSPKYMGHATTALFEGSMAMMRGEPGAGIDFEYIRTILLYLAGLYVLSAIFGYVQQYVMAGVSQRIVLHLRREAQGKLSRLPLKYFDTRTHGEVMSRISGDIDNIGATLQQIMVQFISSLVTMVGILVMMLTISPLMTLITLVTLPLSFWVTKAIAKRSQSFFVNQQRSLGSLNGHVEEMYTGHSIVKAFGREQHSLKAFSRINEELYESGWRAQFVSGMIMPLMIFIGNIGYVLICVAGGILASSRTITIGDVQAFIQYSGQFTMPITQVANIANLIQSTAASAERVFELMDEEEEVPEADPAARLSTPRGHVTFEHVRFGYQPDSPLMEDLNIEIRPGQTAAIVGPTGAGKTTLVNLLMRFYELQGGRIAIDGTDIRELPRRELRSLFGMVLQDTWLFGGTIRDNIAYGRDGASDEAVVQAARAAHADHFIRTLPDGYGTVLNEEASNLSQGQKQLLTIARAILADPPILILDEATSSVDTRTEAFIQQAMKELMKGRTSFVIAHRLSTIRDADVILVMNGGRVIEQGSHSELLARGGFYTELYNSQFAGHALQEEAG